MFLLQHDHVMEYIDKPSLTSEQLFGTIGGLFNLWIGITFFTLIELLDLCLVMLTASCWPCSKEKAKVSRDQTMEVPKHRHCCKCCESMKITSADLPRDIYSNFAEGDNGLPKVE